MGVGGWTLENVFVPPPPQAANSRQHTSPTARFKLLQIFRMFYLPLKKHTVLHSNSTRLYIYSFVENRAR